MNRYRLTVLIISLVALAFSVLSPSCGNGVNVRPEDDNVTVAPDTIMAYNREMVESENQDIDDFTRRHRWKVIMSPTGLRYRVTKQGKGPLPEPGCTVSINYSVTLLNGDTVIAAKEGRNARFSIGKRAVTSGLEEGVRMLGKGGRAKLVVPSHLAYGLLGDLDRIPTRAALVYDLELVDFSCP